MKIIKFSLLLCLCFFFSGCYKDNEAILLPCKDKPTTINEFKWEGPIPTNNNFIYKSEIIGDNIFLFCDSLQSTKLIIYDKAMKSSQIIYIPGKLHESVILDTELYFVENVNNVASIAKMNLRTEEKTIVVSEYPGFFIENLQAIDGKLFYFVNISQTWTLAKVKMIDPRTQAVSDFHHNSLNPTRSFVRNAFVWKSDIDSYKVTYLHTDPTLALTSFDPKSTVPEYTNTFPFNSSVTVNGTLGKNKDFYLQHFNNTHLTSVLDLVTGTTKFEFAGRLSPHNPYHSLTFDNLIDANNGNVIIGTENRSKILFSNKTHAFLNVSELVGPTTLRQLNLNSRCFEFEYAINIDVKDHVFLDEKSDEIIIVSQKSNTVAAYEIRK